MKKPNLIRKFAATTAVALSLATFAPVGVSLASASGCTFSYGFGALDTMIPNQVGGCLGEPTILSNGNTVQQTTAGLMAYNPADNVPEFTNGSTTWLIGPQGQVLTRSNNQRYTFEAPVSNVAGVFLTHDPDTSVVACLTAMINEEGLSRPQTGLFELPTNLAC